MRLIVLLRGAVLSSVVIAALLSASPEDGAKSAAQLRLDALNEQIRAAHTAGDARAYMARSRDMLEFLNASPSSILQVMSAQAFSHDDEGALASFEQFVAMGQSSPGTLESPVFADLRKSERFKALEARMHANEEPVARGSTVFEIQETGLVPEDIDYDPATRRFYVSSVLKNKLLAFDTAGRGTVFAQAPDSLPAMALKVDPKRRRLWVTEVGLNGFASVARQKWNTSVILVYDLDSGHLIHRLEGPAHATFGDLALTPDGDAIVSDNDGGVYRVDHETWRMERLDAGEFISPQTPAVSPDGHSAYIPDYVRGIALLDLRTKSVTWMAGGHALSGIDGLYLTGRTLLATQNGASPERVVRFELDKSMTRIVSESIIERATPTLGDPTHGIVLDGFFYYIANSGWDGLQDDGTAKPGSVPARSRIMRVPL